MTISDIKIRKIITEGRLRAVVSITIDNALAVHDIKVVQGEQRLFVAMPSRKDENHIFRDIVHPISPEARNSIETQILEAYQRQIALNSIEEEFENYEDDFEQDLDNDADEDSSLDLD
ncbi:MAG: septation regulator SpoVG [Ruminococcus sp.]|jgi:stage V sporulation protein G|nr:septation regulator SpoVG [Ruminococcus sp.]